MKNTDIETKRKKAGERLKECMKLRNISNAEFIGLIKNEQVIDSSFFSQMRNGTRSITYDNALLFAKYLDVDHGYLLGEDDFESNNYQEYEKRKNAEKEIPKHKEKWLYYSRYLKPVGSRIINTGIPDDCPEKGYITIMYGTERADISFSEMDEFHEEIESYIRKALAHMMQKHKYDVGYIPK